MSKDELILKLGVAGMTGILLAAAILEVGSKHVVDKETARAITAEMNEEYTRTAADLEPVIPETVKLATGEEEPMSCRWERFDLTESDFELICRTVYCEAGNQDVDTQTMVALTVLNRLVSDIFPDNVEDVIYQEFAYEVTTWKNFEEIEWTNQVGVAVTYALLQNEHPSDMYYFRTDDYHSFAEDYMKSGDLYFSTERKEK